MDILIGAIVGGLVALVAFQSQNFMDAIMKFVVVVGASLLGMFVALLVYSNQDARIGFILFGGPIVFGLTIAWLTSGRRTERFLHRLNAWINRLIDRIVAAGRPASRP